MKTIQTQKHLGESISFAVLLLAMSIGVIVLMSFASGIN